MQTFTCKTRVFSIRVQVRTFKWKIFGKPCLKMFDAYCVGYWSIRTLVKHGNRMQPEFRFGAEDCVGAARVHNIGFFMFLLNTIVLYLPGTSLRPSKTQKRFWRFYATIWSMKLSHTLGKPSPSWSLLCSEHLDAVVGFVGHQTFKKTCLSIDFTVGSTMKMATVWNVKRQ